MGKGGENNTTITQCSFLTIISLLSTKWLYSLTTIFPEQKQC